MTSQPRFDLLDHGYLTFIESWGSDERVVETARMSTGGGFRSWDAYRTCDVCGRWWGPEIIEPAPCVQLETGEWIESHRLRHVPRGDAGLLNYLYAHRHDSPFEFAGAVFEIQAPLFVFREWHRHRTQSYNEASARYAQVPELFYVPSPERLAHGGQSASNRQASGEVLAAPTVEAARARILRASQAAFEEYRALLSLGVARELARVVLPVNMYSRMRAQAVLRNWLAFLTLRSAPDAQWEIRQYAHAIANVLERLYPRTMALFVGGR